MVQRQKGLIVRLGAAGVSTLDAQRILWLLESNLRRLENHRDFLKANFSSASDDQRATSSRRTARGLSVNKVVDLFVRITADEKALSALHQARPPGVMEHLLSAELHARGLDRFTRDTPSLLTSVCLFDWNSGRQIWPPRRPPMAAAFATSMVPACDPADWANNYERRAAAQQRERQYRADYYARTTREQEERENREARERFIASQHKNST